EAVRGARVIARMGRLRQGGRPVEAGNKDGALSGLRDAVLLGVQVPGVNPVPLAAQNVRVQVPHGQHGRDLLEREPLVRAPKVDCFQRPSEGFEDEGGARVAERGEVHGLAPGHCPCQLGNRVQGGAAGALPGHAKGLAGRGRDQTGRGDSSGAVVAHIAMDGGVPGCAPGGNGGVIELDAKHLQAEAAGGHVPAAGAGEKVYGVICGHGVVLLDVWDFFDQPRPSARPRALYKRSASARFRYRPVMCPLSDDAKSTSTPPSGKILNWSSSTCSVSGKAMMVLFMVAPK